MGNGGAWMLAGTTPASRAATVAAACTVVVFFNTYGMANRSEPENETCELEISVVIVMQRQE